MNKIEARFTKEMRKTHTILIPEMLEYQFPLLRAALIRGGYNAEILTNRESCVIETGKKYVHNDMCFPAVAIIGQMLNAVLSGQYNPHKVAFLLPQTGGGCRASNYYPLLKKALKAAGFEYIPVISLNLSSIKANSGFSVSLKMIKAAVSAVLLGDLLMHLYHQTAPYEINRGESDKKLKYQQERLFNLLCKSDIISKRRLGEVSREILRDFSEIKLKKTAKTKIGIVGELYIKYCMLGNRETERFLAEHGCEIQTAGFAVYSLYTVESELYSPESPAAIKSAARLLLKYLTGLQNAVCDAVLEFPRFSPLPKYGKYFRKAGEIISPECITGDGWLISAEAEILAESGCKRILTLSPFGCLVSHINCKGIANALRKNYPNISVTSVECDADTSLALFHSRLLLAAGDKNI